MDKIELLGSACFSHGPYTFYKAVKVNNGRVLRLGNFFLTKLWTDTDLVSIGELQLLWIDSRGSNQPLASLRLYFLPENTPDGRRDTHGEDEVLTISEKIVVHVHDLVTWLAPNLDWSWGREVTFPITPSTKPEEKPCKPDQISPQVLTDPGIDFSDVEKQQKSQENESIPTSYQDESSRVVVLSYPRYCRYRALLRRLDGAPAWLSSRVVAALGGFTAVPGTRVLFCRDTFDYPDLEGHELLCNHLAPKLKGRPRRKRKKRSVSPGESSNESEASVASTSRSSTKYLSTNSTLKPPLSSGVRRSERKVSGDEQKFITDVQSFMNTRGTPVGKMPLLGYRQIDLYLFYKKVQKLGGYDSVTGGRLWKSIYDEIGGNTGSTSAATITRRHYERLLLPYERHQRGEETKVRPVSRRSKSISDITISEIPEISEMKLERRSETPELPINGGTTNLTSSTTITSITDITKISLTIATLPTVDKPKTEGKISSLRSVRVKPERLKSLNTIIATTTTTVQNSNNEPPSPPLSTGNSSTASSTPASTPSTTPTGGQPTNCLDRQLNSPLMTQSSSPPISLSVTTVTPPPERDFKIELKCEKSLITHQGKENIPIFDKTLNRSTSPEVIDLELEPDGVRDKLVIPSFKKRKLEILREGGLEVTAIDLDSHPSVIQPPAPSCNSKNDEKMLNPPKLISVTVTPDISHMLPSPNEVREIKSLKSGNLTVNFQPINNNINNNDNNNSNNNNNNNSNFNNSSINSNSSLLQVYSPNSQSTDKIFVSPVLPNAQAAPPKVTQSRSIFSHNEKMVYGNPKDILTSPNCLINNVSGILDLTAQRAENNERQFSRPNLEIVRVPVVPRPNLINSDIKSSESHNHHRQTVNHNSFNYAPMLDSRTMASNNLEITLVSPKAKISAQPLIRSSSPPIRHHHQQQQQQQTNGIINANNHLALPQTRLRPNGKYPKMIEPINPYSQRKISQVIPNVPNLNHLNNNCFPPKTINSQIIRDSDRKKSVDTIRDHQRRISEGDSNFKNFVDERRLQSAPSSVHHQQNHQKLPFPRQHSDSRRHSVPNLPTGFIPALPTGTGNSAGNAVPYFNGQLTPSSNSKYMSPMIDPIYYPALYNGLFPTSVQQNLPPQRSNSVITSVAMQTQQQTPFIPPLEFTDYYKHFFNTQQQRIPGIGPMQSTLPTTK